jgi:hypothetical protein
MGARCASWKSEGAAAHMTAAAVPALAQAVLAASLDSAKFFSTDAASSTMCSSRGLARSSDTRNGSKPGRKSEFRWIRV